MSKSNHQKYGFSKITRFMKSIGFVNPSKVIKSMQWNGKTIFNGELGIIESFRIYNERQVD